MGMRRIDLALRVLELIETVQSQTDEEGNTVFIGPVDHLKIYRGSGSTPHGLSYENRVTDESAAWDWSNRWETDVRGIEKGGPK